MTTTYGAVAPGTDLGRHARSLQAIHDSVLAGSRPERKPRAVVARSWARALTLGLDPDARALHDPLPEAELLRRRHGSRLALVVDEVRRVLTSVADASLFLVVVTDADGVILWREGAARVLRQADSLGFSEGATWTESAVGTNAIGTALAEAAPVQLFSAEHFELQQHPWYCTAHPVHDPRSGALLGVVDVSGPALTLHPAVGALVESAVRLAEAGLWRHHHESLARLRRDAAPRVAAAGGPLLVVDDHGWVAHASGIDVRERVEAPRADCAIAVPGLGLCLPERLGDGWLVRPTPHDHGREQLVGRLSLGVAPVLELRADGDPWRVTLTRGHADLLRRIVEAGPDGVGAAALSVALHGDAAHQVTVRAEVSRLRRRVGALLTSAPYRLAAGVALTVVDDA